MTKVLSIVYEPGPKKRFLTQKLDNDRKPRFNIPKTTKSLKIELFSGGSQDKILELKLCLLGYSQHSYSQVHKYSYC